MGWITKVEGSRGVRYKAGYRDPNRHVRYKTFTRKRDAEAYLAAVETAKNAGSYIDPRLGRVTLEAFWEHFWRTARPPAASTQALYQMHARLHILPRLGARPLSSLTKADIRVWIAELRESGVGEPTVNAAHRLLRRVLSVAVDEGRIPSNPAARMGMRKPPPREIRFLSMQELVALGSAVDDRYRVLVLTLGLCGLRIGEASALRVRNVDPLRRRLHITESAAEVAGHRIVKETKTGRSRSIKLPTSLAEDLAAHLARYSNPMNPDALVFTGRDGGPIRQTAFRNRVFQPAARSIGLEPVPRVHDLRHSAVALAIEQGATPKEIQELVGHSSILMTMDVYGHLFETIQERLADRLDAAYRIALEPDASEEVRYLPSGG